MAQEKKSLLRPLPIFCALICVGILIAYAVLIYTNNQYKKNLTTSLENSFLTNVIIEDFQYSPISKSLHIKNLAIYHKNTKNIAIAVKDIRASIPNIKQQPLNILDIKITGLELHTHLHNGDDLKAILKTPIKRLESNKNLELPIIINNINIAESVLLAPAIKTKENNQEYISFIIPEISIDDINDTEYTKILSEVASALSSNIKYKMLKHNLSYKVLENSTYKYLENILE